VAQAFLPVRFLREQDAILEEQFVDSELSSGPCLGLRLHSQEWLCHPEMASP